VETAIDDGIRRLAGVVQAVRERPRRGHRVADPSRPLVAVYGTLRRGERNHDLLAGAELIEQGTIRGAIHDMPANAERTYGYPALVADPAARVVVEIYRLPDVATLARLDALEAYDPADEEGSEYIRFETELLDGTVQRAWAYRYNADPAALGRRIASGDWVAGDRG